MNSDGSNDRKLIDTNGKENVFAAYSPDGKKIVFSTQPTVDRRTRR